MSSKSPKIKFCYWLTPFDPLLAGGLTLGFGISMLVGLGYAIKGFVDGLQPENENSRV